MKPNQLQYKIADFIVDQSAKWKFSKDINHPYHITLIEESVSDLHLSIEESFRIRGNYERIILLYKKTWGTVIMIYLQY